MSKEDDTAPVADTLNEVGVLKRREIEARIVAPLLQRLGEEFGAERVAELAAEVVVDVAREQGAQLAEFMGGDDLAHFGGSMEAWTRGGALEIDVIEESREVFAFNVTRCRYAEMYRRLGMADLGATLSCNRDGTMIQGFNPRIRFTRTQTIMSGADHCDFVYQLPETTVELGESG
ncbi:MAG: L-2-amino-thiazoline-4-carboxylic acid hydrolase [Actinomycetota bacterium]